MAVTNTAGLDVGSTLEALSLSADRAGLLLAGDVAAGLGMLAREELAPGAPRVETPEAIIQSVQSRRDLRELIGFALSDDFFRLRQRVGLSLG